MKSVEDDLTEGRTGEGKCHTGTTVQAMPLRRYAPGRVSECRHHPGQRGRISNGPRVYLQVLGKC